MKSQIVNISLCLLMVLAISCREKTSSPPMHSGIFFRSDASGTKRLPEWEFIDKGNGRYVLYDKDVSYDFLIDVRAANKWNYHALGANARDNRIIPGKPYTLGRMMHRTVQCTYSTIHCDSIVLQIDDARDEAYITLHSSQRAEPFKLLDFSSPSGPDISYRKLSKVDKYEVLALGNSLLFSNRQDRIFDSIAHSTHTEAMWVNHCHGQASLEKLWNEGCFLDRDYSASARAQIASHAWTHIVLQEYSLKPLYEPEAFAESVHRWVEYIRKHCLNRDAHIILVVNWPKLQAPGEYAEIAAMLEHNCRAAASREGVAVAPVGTAYSNLFSVGGQQAVMALYNDDMHPTVAGTYLAACIEFAVITGRSPMDISWKPATVTPQQGQAMRELAAQVVH